MVDPEDVEEIIAGFAAFLSFLGDESIIPKGHGGRLAARVAELEDEFRRAVADSSNWGMGKRLWAQAVSESVDAGDERQL